MQLLQLLMNQILHIIPLYDESFRFVELLSQLLRDHLFARLLLDAGFTAVFAAAVAGSGTS